jgi:hypothetical protein
MSGRRAVIGLCMLCALFVSAVAAQGASAAGFTAVTCQPVVTPGPGFSKAHCKAADAVASNATFVHAAIAPGTGTEISGSDLNTEGKHTGAVLKATVAGTAIELKATEVSGTGSMVNKEEAGEMFAHGEGVIVYKGVTEAKAGCKVVGVPGGAGVVETKPLTAATKGLAANRLKFTPKEGTLFAEFKLEGCVVANTYKVVGSVLGVTDGTTTTTSHETITTEKTLRLQSAAGPLAGIEGTLTITGRAATGSGPYTPLGLT